MTARPLGKRRPLAGGRFFSALCLPLAALLLAGCGASEPTVSPFDLDLSLSEPETGALVDVTKQNQPPEVLSEQVDATQPCHFAETRPIEVKSPIRLSSYALDTLGIRETATSDKACLASLIRDGAQILLADAGRITAFYPNRFEAFLTDYSAEIDIEVIEGRYDFEKNRLIAGIDGRRVDREKTRDLFFKAVLEHAPQFEIAIATTPAFSHDVQAFADFRPAHRIGHYTTRFSRSKNRTVNVKLAAAAMDGLFLMPGAEFSYNDWVGERSEARGFKEAPVIEQGELVEGLGGGACQVSSTIHAAALLAGLAIEERYNHSLPSSYIPVGLDAVVSYPNLDLRVKNPLPVPVVLKVSTKDDLLTAEFFSSEPRTSRVLFRKEIVDEIPFREIITVAPELEEGSIKIRKRGKTGYKVQRGRIFWSDGKETFEKLNMDIYQPQTQQTSIALGVVYPESL